MGEQGAYTVTAAAEWLGRSTDTVRRLIAEGELPAVKVRGTSMIARSALERLVDPTVVDLRAVATDDLRRIISALTQRAAEIDNDLEQGALVRLRDRLAARLAYTEALEVPLALEVAS